MLCWKCQKECTKEREKISFHEECPFCGSDLHVCKNCKYFSLGKPHDCSILSIDPVIDKEKGNFCEEFIPKPYLPTSSNTSVEDVSEKLFQEKPKKKKDFHSLFDD